MHLWFFESHRVITSFALCPDEIIPVDIVLSEEKIRRRNSPGPSINYFLKKLLEPFVFEASHHLGFSNMPFSWGHILVRPVSFCLFHCSGFQHLNMHSEYAFSSYDWLYTQESWVCWHCLWTTWGLRCLTQDAEVRGFAGEVGFTLPSTKKSFIFLPCLAPFYFRVNCFDLSAGGMVLWSYWLL